MINSADIRKKALVIWDSQRFLRAFVDGEALFPLEIRFAKPSGRQISDQFAQVRGWIQELQANSKHEIGYGYALQFHTVNHRQLGNQQIPRLIYFETGPDYLKFIGKQSAFERFEQIVASVHDRPQLMPLLQQKPLTILEHAEQWEQLLAVCDYFARNPRPQLYMRQLDIAGIDTKFIDLCRYHVRYATSLNSIFLS